MNKNRLNLLLVSGLIVVFAGLGGIYIFSHRQKVSSTDSHVYGDQLLYTVRKILLDFERPDELVINDGAIAVQPSYSGNRSVILDSTVEFGSGFSLNAGSIPSHRKIRRIEVEFFMQSKDVGSWLTVVLEAKGRKDETIAWTGMPVSPADTGWHRYVLNFDVSAGFESPGNVIRLFFWNKEKKSFSIDDVLVSFKVADVKDDNTVAKTNFYFDLESDKGLTNTSSLTNMNSHSGNSSSVMSARGSKSASFRTFYADAGSPDQVLLSTWLWPDKAGTDAILVCEINDSQGRQVYRTVKQTGRMMLKAREWNKVNAGFVIPNDVRTRLTDESVIEIFVSNRSSFPVYADDFEIVYSNTSANGNFPNAVMGSAGYNFSFHRYLPPYQVINVSKEKVTATTALYPTDTLLAIDISGSGNDLLLRLKGNRVEAFRVCHDSFSFSGAISDERIAQANHFLAGNFAGDERDEVIVVSAEKILLMRLRSSDCKSLTGLTVETFYDTTFYLPSIQQVLAADLDGDLTDELITLGAGNYSIWRYTESGWNVSFSGKLNPKKIQYAVAGRFIPDEKKDILLLEDETGLHFYSLNGSKLSEIHPAGGSAAEHIGRLADDAIAFDVNFDGTDELILFENERRFGMYVCSFDNEGVKVSGRCEFTGYEGNDNPKFYELRKILPGRFRGHSNLLVITQNCNQWTNDGIDCETFEIKNDMPGGTSVYSFQVE